MAPQIFESATSALTSPSNLIYWSIGKKIPNPNISVAVVISDNTTKVRACRYFKPNSPRLLNHIFRLIFITEGREQTQLSLNLSNFVFLDLNASIVTSNKLIVVFVLPSLISSSNSCQSICNRNLSQNHISKI